jgi:hypothetical protein
VCPRSLAAYDAEPKRLEEIGVELTRREMLKMGLLGSAALALPRGGAPTLATKNYKYHKQRSRFA